MGLSWRRPSQHPQRSRVASVVTAGIAIPVLLVLFLLMPLVRGFCSDQSGSDGDSCRADATAGMVVIGVLIAVAFLVLALLTMRSRPEDRSPLGLPLPPEVGPPLGDSHGEKLDDRVAGGAPVSGEGAVPTPATAPQRTSLSAPTWQDDLERTRIRAWTVCALGSSLGVAATFETMGPRSTSHEVLTILAAGAVMVFAARVAKGARVLVDRRARFCTYVGGLGALCAAGLALGGVFAGG